MGAALKMDPTRIKVAEFWKVAGCPLARALRDKFKKKKMALKKKVLCVFSDELLKNRGKNSSCGTDACLCPKVRHERSDAELQNANLVDHEWCSSKAQINGTMAHSTAIFGFMIAGLVMQDIYRKELVESVRE
jgi:tRNA A37 threonylcarbamoyladenosine dehydratase